MTLLNITVFWFFAFCCTSAADGQVLKAPPKVIYRLVGSDVVLSWCIQKDYRFKQVLLKVAVVTFYLKTPLDKPIREKAIASIKNGKIQVLPDESRYKTLFSPSQINVTKTNCVIDGRTNDMLRNFSLIIRNLSLPQGKTFKFEGDYGLKKVGKDNETSLKILEPPTFVVKNTNENIVIREGETLSERCSTVGELSMIVKWFKDGVMLTQGINSSILVINATKRSDSGTYCCSATNELVQIQRWFNLSVLYPPKIKKLTTSNSSSFIGQHVIFCCYSNGNPPPAYRWIFPNGNLLSQNGRCLDVELNTRHNFGNYSCVVSNTNGNDTETANIRQLFPPNKISRINYDARPFGIFLSWDKTKYDGGSNVIHYIVLIFDKSGGQEFQVTISRTNYDVKHLTRNANYTICVQAENIVGKSNKTCASIQTPNKGKPEQPSITDIVPVGITPGVKIIWYAPSPGILYYIVKYSKEDSKQWIERNTTGSLLTFQLKDLQSGNYAVQVIAVNEYGESFPSENKTFTISPAVTDYTTSGPTATSSDEASSSRNTGVIAGSVVAGTIVVVIAMVLLWRYARRRTQNGSPSELDTSLTKIKRNPDLGDIGNEGNVVFGMERISTKIHELTESDYENLNQKSRIKPNEKDWEVRRENIKIKKIIGKGSFGQVAKGILMIEGEDGGIKKQVVAVKMTKDGCSDSDKKDLLSELNIMKCLPQHANVIQLLGYVTRTEPLLVVITFVPFGDLLGYLRKSRGKVDRYFNDPDIKPKTNLTSKELIRFARDVACGMEFLASNKVVHRDLAARNVLVGEELVCKITDFGMARDVYQDNIYTKTSRGRIPVKWTAYESLMYNKYTTQSDVWSYGILLFEIFTIGGTPYPGVKGRDVYSLLKEGYRIEKPNHVDNELYSVMSRCWETKPEERPSFSSLKNIMKEMERKHEDYVNLREYNSSLYENIEDFE